MANYNHEILVNYLRDVYSMELLVRKIEDDIHSTREDIQCEQALVEKVESTPIPAEGNISPKKDITPYMIAGFLILFISFGFFTLPSIGAISGILGIGVSIILFSCAGSVSSDNTKMQEEEKEKIKEKMDIIYIDPPYDSDFAIKSVEHIINQKLIDENSTIIIETDNEGKILEELRKIETEIIDKIRYGRATLIFIKIRKG